MNSRRPQRRPRPGSKLDCLLRQRNISLYKLAQMAGINYASASRCLNGRPRRQTAEERIAIVLGVPVGNLFPAFTPKPKPKTPKKEE